MKDVILHGVVSILLIIGLILDKSATGLTTFMYWFLLVLNILFGVITFFTSERKDHERNKTSEQSGSSEGSEGRSGSPD